MTYTDPNQIGEVTEITGIAKIIRTDGTEEPITLGTEIYIGDIVETDDDGAVNIGFLDESSFAVSEDARISIDEFVYDPASESGDQDFSVVRGVFMYTSGLIGRENPDSVEIDTPVGSIGIRGTIIGGKIVEGGESQVSVLEGAIVVRNDGGEQLLTNQFDTVTVKSFDIAPSKPQVLDVERVANDYSAIKSVSSSLFSSFDDQIKQKEVAPQNDNKPNVESKTEEQVEDKEASAEEVLDEVAEDVAVEKSKEAPENTEEKQQNSVEKLTNKIESIRNDIEVRDDISNEGKKQFLSRIKEKLGLSVQDNLLDPEVIANLSAEQIADKLELLEQYNLDENSDGSTTHILIGKVGLESNTANVTYSISATLNGIDVSSQFLITPVVDAGLHIGHVYFSGTDSGDFEAGTEYELTITSENQDTGEIIDRFETLHVSDVNEAPVINTALEDKYSVTGNVGGLIPFGVDGAFITKLHIQDPENATFTAGDFSINGNVFGQLASDFFEISNDGSNFVLKLKSGFTVYDDSGNFSISDDGGTSSVSGTTPVTAGDFNISVELDGSSETIKLSAGNVTHVTGTSAVTLSGSDDIVFGDNADNVFVLQDENFKFIKGGHGHDTIKLDYNGLTAHMFDFTSTQSNLTGNSADLKSIEEFRFTNQTDQMKMNIQDLKDLLRTSDNDEVVFATGNSGGGTTGSSDGYNGLNFKDGGTNVQLTNHGFTNEGTVVDNGETFVKYTHVDFGDVLIEQNINGASTGGIVV